MCRLRLGSGIKQGCPLSGTLFALCLDPLIRCYMCRITFASSRLCAFADDIGVAMMRIVSHVLPILALLRRWGAACGLRVNSTKTQLVTVGDVEQARRVVAAIDAFADIQVCRAAKYLGVFLGPDAPQEQFWPRPTIAYMIFAYKATALRPECTCSMCILLASFFMWVDSFS